MLQLDIEENLLPLLIIQIDAELKVSKLELIENR
jgi:hypothetical protein